MTIARQSAPLARGSVQIEDFAAVAGRDERLCVVTTMRADASMQGSVVNAGVLAHPLSGRAEGRAAVLVRPRRVYSNG